MISVIDDWWGGRHMADMLPRLFFEHFTDTSFAAERDGELAGFLVGFRSQSRLAEAYIHFVGIHPARARPRSGPATVRALLRGVRARGCDRVRAVTSPVNRGSIGFHQRMGFDIEPGIAGPDGIAVRPDTTARARTGCGSSGSWTLGRLTDLYNERVIRAYGRRRARRYRA